MTTESSPYLKAFQSFWQAFEQHDYEQCAAMMTDDFQWMIKPKSLQHEPLGRDVWKTMVAALFGEGFPKGKPNFTISEVFETAAETPTVIGQIESNGTSFKGNELHNEYVFIAKFEKETIQGEFPRLQSMMEFMDSKTTLDFMQKEQMSGDVSQSRATDAQAE